MIQTIPVREDNIFAFKVTGTLTDTDYQQFLPKLTSLIEKHGAISLLIELDDFHGWEAKAAWDDFKFGMEYKDVFVKIAIVGTKKWQEYSTKIGNWFMHGDVKFFYDLDEANMWIK